MFQHHTHRKTGHCPHAKRRSSVYLVAVILALSIEPARAQQPTTAADVETIVPRLETYVDKTMRDWGTPGVAIGIVAEDQLVYAKGFGVRHLGSSAPVDADTVFQIGSTTKAFLGVTEAIAVGDGLLAWSDRVIDRDLSFRLADPWVTREFRIADLLAQRSGLPFSTLTNMMLYGYDRSAVIAALNHIEPVTSFRSTFAYQNAFHLAAGRIVADAFDAATWEEVLHDKLLAPIGMTSTSNTAEAITTSSNHATGHRFDGRETVEDPFAVFPYDAGGAGNINSTVRDMARWLRFHINRGVVDGIRIVNDDVLAPTYEPRIALTGPIADDAALGDHDTLSYATGWIVHGTPEGRLIEHAGGTVGFVSLVAFDPDRRFGIVVLCNQSAFIGHGLAIPFAKYAIDLLQGRAPPDYAASALRDIRDIAAMSEAEMAPPPDAVVPRPLTEYTGTYRSPVLGDVALEDDGTGLGFELGPRRLPVTLTPWSGDIFVARIPLPVIGDGGLVEQVKLRFSSDAAGRIARFEWLGEGDASGQPPFERIPDEDLE